MVNRRSRESQGNKPRRHGTKVLLVRWLDRLYIYILGDVRWWLSSVWGETPKAARETAVLMTQSHPIGNSLKEMVQLTTDAIEDLIEAFFGGVRGNAQEEDIQDH